MPQQQLLLPFLLGVQQLGAYLEDAQCAVALGRRLGQHGFDKLQIVAGRIHLPCLQHGAEHGRSGLQHEWRAAKLHDAVKLAADDTGRLSVFVLSEQGCRLGGKRGVQFYGVARVARLACPFGSRVGIVYSLLVAVGLHIHHGDVVVKVRHIVLGVHTLRHVYALAVGPQGRVGHSHTPVDNAAGRVLVDENLVVA